MVGRCGCWLCSVTWSGYAVRYPSTGISLLLIECCSTQRSLMDWGGILRLWHMLIYKAYYWWEESNLRLQYTLISWWGEETGRIYHRSLVQFCTRQHQTKHPRAVLSDLHIWNVPEDRCGSCHLRRFVAHHNRDSYLLNLPAVTGILESSPLRKLPRRNRYDILYNNIKLSHRSCAIYTPGSGNYSTPHTHEEKGRPMYCILDWNFVRLSTLPGKANLS